MTAKRSTKVGPKARTHGEELAGYIGFVARLHDYWGLGGTTDAERLAAVAEELSVLIRQQPGWEGEAS